MRHQPRGQVQARVWAGVQALCASLLAGAVLVAAPASRTAHADAPAARVAVLARGINITHWFRFPPSRGARAMAGDLDDGALSALKQAGFTYVRLGIGPEEVMDGQSIAPDKLAAILEVVARIEHAGLGVMVEPHPELMQHWNLQRNPQARAILSGFWRDLAPALKRFPAALTFPELVNEPSLDDPRQWDDLQRQLLALVRSALPDDTVILTGTNWSSIDGLLKVTPVSDPDVVYSFHTYEPQLLTLLGVWDPAIKQNQLAQALPFPVQDQASCNAKVATIQDAHTLAVARYWCSLHQDSASLAKNLGRAANWGRMHHVSVAMTEFGAVQKLNAPARLAYMSAMRQSAVRLELPWGLWALDDQMGFGQPPDRFTSSSQLSPALLQALGLHRS